MIARSSALKVAGSSLRTVMQRSPAVPKTYNQRQLDLRDQSPETVYLVAKALRSWNATPKRQTIVREICRILGGCGRHCLDCIGGQCHHGTIRGLRRPVTSGCDFSHFKVAAASARVSRALHPCMLAKLSLRASMFSEVLKF